MRDVIQHQAVARLRVLVVVVIVVVAVPRRHAHIYETLLIYAACTCFSLRAPLEIFFRKNKNFWKN